MKVLGKKRKRVIQNLLWPRSKSHSKDAGSVSIKKHLIIKDIVFIDFKISLIPIQNHRHRTGDRKGM